jgi:hypothetical protein
LECAEASVTPPTARIAAAMAATASLMRMVLSLLA